MKTKRIAAVLFLGMMMAYMAAPAQEAALEIAPETSDVRLFFGPRLHTDTTFYLQAGVQSAGFDAAVYVGFNNGFGVGVHGYFLQGSIYDVITASLFAGVEGYILYVDGVMTTSPALALGFAVGAGSVTFLGDVLIHPTTEHSPVPITLAFGVLFGWGL